MAAGHAALKVVNPFKQESPLPPPPLRPFIAGTQESSSGQGGIASKTSINH